MENTYLQQVLRVLTKTEWKAFADFVASPYFNKNDKFVRFYKLLQPYFPHFELTEKEKEKIYINTTESNSYNDAGYRNLCSDFLALLMEFIAQEALKVGNTVKDQYQNGFLVDRKVLDLAEKNMKKVEASINKLDLKLREKLFTAIWINDLRILHSIYYHVKNMHASNTVMLEDKTPNLIAEWTLMRVFSSVMNNTKAKRAINVPAETEKLKIFLDLYEALAPFKHKETQVIYLIFKMQYYESGDAYYYEALEIVKSLDFSQDNYTIENLVIGLLYYADRKVLTDESWRKELFELYNLKLEKRLWRQIKGLSYASLFNVITNALQLGKIEYAEEVLEKYVSEISEDIRSSVFNLCHAWILFFKGDYEGAHEGITRVITENLLIKYELRSLQCFIYLQKQEWELLNAALESFRQFIAYNKNNMESAIADLFNSICKNVSALAKLHPDYKQKDKDKLIQSLNNEKTSYMRNWMLQKIINGK